MGAVCDPAVVAGPKKSLPNTLTAEAWGLAREGRLILEVASELYISAEQASR